MKKSMICVTEPTRTSRQLITARSAPPAWSAAWKSSRRWTKAFGNQPIDTPKGTLRNQRGCPFLFMHLQSNPPKSRRKIAHLQDTPLQQEKPYPSGPMRWTRGVRCIEPEGYDKKAVKVCWLPRKEKSSVKTLFTDDFIVWAVPRAGIEPARIASLVFETNASTNSAIGANASAKVRKYW